MELREFILDFLAKAGGKSTYPELHKATDFKQQRELRPELKALRKAGIVGEVIEVTPSGNVHALWLVKEGE